LPGGKVFREKALLKTWAKGGGKFHYQPRKKSFRVGPKNRSNTHEKKGKKEEISNNLGGGKRRRGGGCSVSTAGTEGKGGFLK